MFRPSILAIFGLKMAGIFGRNVQELCIIYIQTLCNFTFFFLDGTTVQCGPSTPKWTSPSHLCSLISLSRFQFYIYEHLFVIYVSCSVQCACIPSYYQLINLLKTKRNLLYIINQSVPRSKHFPPRL